MLDKYKGKKTIGIIPARMESSRFYGKPLAKILGKEMIQWVYEICMGSKLLKDVCVATDHEEIRKFCEAKGMRCVMTLSQHKNCAERSNEVCQKVGADFVVEVQGDEPTLLPEHLDDFIDRAFDFEQFDVVTQYADITAEEARDPQNVKIAVGPEGRALFFTRAAVPHDFKNRQAKYYKQVGLYVWPAASLERFSRTPKGYLESLEDTHMLRLIENHFDARLVHTTVDNVGVDIPEHIKQAEEFLARRKS
ncbi:MAG: 3-deoxy-manno-octulosonate cytidylyltransferase [Candidatus Omnitrophica bacterium]|nr:3-deoxy-manno-octulosonate cytidylyltransferase [Candidatus Omnitrophota bacterium]